jgi:hypothetical protein
MAKLEITSVAMVRPFAGGPDEVTVLAKSETGAQLKFFVEVPRGAGEKYCESTGVKKYTSRVEELKVPDGGGKPRRKDLVITTTEVTV